MFSKVRLRFRRRRCPKPISANSLWCGTNNGRGCGEAALDQWNSLSNPPCLEQPARRTKIVGKILLGGFGLSYDRSANSEIIISKLEKPIRMWSWPEWRHFHSRYAHCRSACGLGPQMSRWDWPSFPRSASYGSHRPWGWSSAIVTWWLGFSTKTLHLETSSFIKNREMGLKVIKIRSKPGKSGKWEFIKYGGL